MDLRTGEPVMDFDGNLIQVDISRSFNQYIDVLLHTPVFEETSIRTWGIPVKKIFDIRFGNNWEMMIKYYLSQALNPRNEPLIKEIKEINVEREGNSLNIDLHLLSIFNTENEVEVTLNE